MFSWGGNPGVGSLHRLRDAVEKELAGAARARGARARRAWPRPTPPAPRGCRSACCADISGSDLPKYNPNIKFIDCPFTGERLAAVPAIRPDVAVIHAQKADRQGNVLLWGVTGVQKEAVLAAEARASSRSKRSSIASIRRRAKNAVVLPHWVVSAVCEVKGGAFPSYALGYYPRNNAFYKQWDAIARDRDTFTAWIDRHVRGTKDFAEFRRSLERRPAESGRHECLRAYTADEMMTIAAARMVRNGAALFVGIGLPSAAANLARLTHAPDTVLIYESGTIGTKPNVLPLSIGDGELAETADAVVSVPEMFAYWLQGGRIDLGFLGAAQIDRFANINTTVIGDYHKPSTRLPGAGGAPEIAASCKEVLITLRQNARAFVEKLDFVTSAGHLDGGDSRAKLRLPGQGPDRRDHGPRHPDARSGDEGADADQRASRAWTSRR